MRCPFCGNIDTQVKDSRPAEDHVAIRRRRFCAACVGRFTTYERVQLRDLVVIKSNGRREDFDRDKLEACFCFSKSSLIPATLCNKACFCVSKVPMLFKTEDNSSWFFTIDCNCFSLIFAI